MFQQKFIAVSDTESNPLGQYRIFSSKIVSVYLERNVTLKCDKNKVMQNLLSSIYILV